MVCIDESLTVVIVSLVYTLHINTGDRMNIRTISILSRAILGIATATSLLSTKHGAHINFCESNRLLAMPRAGIYYG
jgi:hypothetical protein